MNVDTNENTELMVEELFNLNKEKYIKFSKYFFRGFKSESILKTAEETYNNYKRFGYSNYLNTNIQVEIYELLKHYSKIDKKIRKPLDEYQLTSSGIYLMDEETSLHLHIVILMAYCKKFEIEEVPMVDRKDNINMFNTKHINKIHKYLIYTDRGSKSYSTGVYLNPKLIQRIVNDSYMTKPFNECCEDGDICNLNSKWWNYKKGNTMGMWEIDGDEVGDLCNEYNLVDGLYGNSFFFSIDLFSEEIRKYSNDKKEIFEMKNYQNLMEQQFNDKCVICLEDFKYNNKKLIIGACGHVFHNKCHHKFVKNNKNKIKYCPYGCRDTTLHEFHMKRFYLNHTMYYYYNSEN